MCLVLGAIVGWCVHYSATADRMTIGSWYRVRSFVSVGSITAFGVTVRVQTRFQTW